MEKPFPIEYDLSRIRKSKQIEFNLPLSYGKPYPLYDEALPVVKMKIDGKTRQMSVKLANKFKDPKLDKAALMREVEAWEDDLTQRRDQANKQRRKWEQEHDLYVNGTLASRAVLYITPPPTLPAELETLPKDEEGRKVWAANFSKHARAANRQRSDEIKAMNAAGHSIISPMSGTVFLQ